MNKVASYKLETALSTDKRVNLIYGLNGTGKSTISNYLYDMSNSEYSDCTIEPAVNTEETEIITYNQKFISDIFYESDTIKGIFSLSKGNKDAKTKIDDANGEIKRLEKEKENITKKRQDASDENEQQKNLAQDRIWNIKREYTGGDRLLDFCLEGLKGRKEELFSYLLKIKKTDNKSSETIEELKQKVQQLNNADTEPIVKISLPTFNIKQIETNDILQKAIVGNKDSAIANLIQKLGNGDWIKQGIKYIGKEDSDICPFCQSHTIKNDFRDELKKYFDKTYEEDIVKIDELYDLYRIEKNKLNLETKFNELSILHELKTVYDLTFNKLNKLFEDNLQTIYDKKCNPSSKMELKAS
jgi:wobble nucleotide-excising tRNase